MLDAQKRSTHGNNVIEAIKSKCNIERLYPMSSLSLSLSIYYYVARLLMLLDELRANKEYGTRGIKKLQTNKLKLSDVYRIE